MRGLNILERFKGWSLLIAKGQTLYGVFRLSKTQDEDCGVIMFDCIMEEYTVKLTDHYPNIIDVRL